MLRNPSDRAYSAFQHVSRGFKEQNSFEEALEMEDGRLGREEKLTPMVMYKDMGLYHEMVKAYQENFKDVHIVIYDDFRDDTESEMKKTYQFLGISDNADIDYVTKHNVGGKRWKNDKVKHLFMKENPLKSIFRRIIPKGLRRGIRNNLVTASTNKVTPMKDQTRIMLNNFF
jgi:hypothetical protein